MKNKISLSPPQQPPKKPLLPLLLSHPQFLSSGIIRTSFSNQFIEYIMQIPKNVLQYIRIYKYKVYIIIILLKDNVIIVEREENWIMTKLKEGIL